MRRTIAATVVVLAMCPLAAAERGTPAEAKALLDKAIAHYKSVGRTQAFADFTARKAPFADRDLYVVCMDANGTVVAHGLSARYVGMSADLMKDAEGKPLGRAAWEAALAAGGKSVHYLMVNPVTRAVEPKVTFFEKLGGDLCGVGAYQTS